MIAYAGEPAYELGRVHGAMDFCMFMRGKVSAGALSEAWADYNALAKLTAVNTDGSGNEAMGVNLTKGD